MTTLPRARRDRGWATILAIVLVLICAAVAASATYSNIAAQREAEARLASERALAAAEAGIDWGLARLRTGRGDLPDPPEEARTLDPSAACTIRWTAGTADGFDDDGDGVADDPGESAFARIASTGESGGERRTLVAVVRRTSRLPAFPAAAQINDVTPSFDSDGKAFRIAGEEHRINGMLDPFRPANLAIASPAEAAVLAAQVPKGREGRVTGAGGSPSAGKVPRIDLDALVAESELRATVILDPGTTTHGALGSPDAAGMRVVRFDGDLHIAGNDSGAGILVVDGDLKITGSFEWVGLVLVRGDVTTTGGGGGKRLIGALVCSGTLSVGGTVDLLYSSDAIALASQSLAVPVVVAWYETGTP